jgi:hypothetical protein
MMRANILDVVTSMFPRFAARRGQEAVVRDVDEFVRNFGATRAQFMHISTEFVRFSEGRFDDPVTRTLLEYEWTLFAVEVSDSHVAPPPADRTAKSLADIRLNPTLQLIAVPFDIDVADVTAERMAREDRSPFIYAVYRTHDHVVVTQSLSEIDVGVLREMAGETDQTGSEDRTAWISDALQLGLAVVHHI